MTARLTDDELRALADVREPPSIYYVNSVGASVVVEPKVQRVTAMAAAAPDLAREVLELRAEVARMKGPPPSAFVGVAVADEVRPEPFRIELPQGLKPPSFPRPCVCILRMTPPEDLKWASLDGPTKLRCDVNCKTCGGMGLVYRES